jgi:signal transduction histidine kinase
MARKVKKPDSGRTILVIDDQDEVLESLQALLEREGHRVITASSGARGLEIFRREAIDLLLVDYLMPRMNGDEVIAAIRRTDSIVPIILQTGYAGEKPPRKTLQELDIQGFHDKSDGPDTLLRWIDAGLKALATARAIERRSPANVDTVTHLSHELRNPLHVIGGYVDLLLSDAFGDLPPTMHPPLHALAGTTQRLSEQVTNFLLWAKLERDALQVERRWLPVGDVVDDCTRLAQLLLDEAPVRFLSDVSEAPASVFTDAAKLKAILRNLVCNAAQFTPHGTIALCVARHGDGIHFVVRDSGPGIEPERHESVFEPFQRPAGADPTHGIGLGLALSRRLAGLLGGDLTVASKAGSGAEFTLRLPVAEALGYHLVD